MPFLPLNQQRQSTEGYQLQRRKGKGKEEYLYGAILVRTHTLNALIHGSHSFTCKLHHA